MEAEVGRQRLAGSGVEVASKVVCGRTSFRAAAITERGARGDGWAVCARVCCVLCAVGGMGADTIGACRSSAMRCSGREVSQAGRQAVRM